MPKNNQEFWMNKLQGNKDRDKFVTRELRKMDWKVIRVWEHELKKPERVAAKLKKYLSKKVTVTLANG
jgi:DNA mismatch endonuclease (patch repair protein)